MIWARMLAYITGTVDDVAIFAYGQAMLQSTRNPLLCDCMSAPVTLSTDELADCLLDEEEAGTLSASIAGAVSNESQMRIK